jgi:hypothetical protein
MGKQSFGWRQELPGAWSNLSMRVDRLRLSARITVQVHDNPEQLSSAPFGLYKVPLRDTAFAA